MRNLLESGWAGGWQPSSSEKGDPTGQAALVLLRMDNLNLDEYGAVRMVRGPGNESVDLYSDADFLSIYSTTLNGIKVRIALIGVLNAIGRSLVFTTTNPRDFTVTSLLPTLTAKRAAFLNALGKVFIFTGATQLEYDGTSAIPVGLPALGLLGVSVNATSSKVLSNLDGSGNYTNWASISSTTYSNVGTDVHGTAAAAPSNIAQIFSFHTVFGSPIDTTDLGGTGHDTPDDLFTFNFKIDDPTQLVWVHIDLYCAATPTPGDYFWHEWDFNTKPPNPDSPYYPFNVVANVKTQVALKRSDFYRSGSDPTKTWASIKEIRIEVGVTGSAVVTWDTLKVSGGTTSVLTGTYRYLQVQARNNGDFIEFSPSSSIINAVLISGSANVNILPGNVNAQANEYWIFRQDPTGGNFYLVQRQTGAYGFLTTTFVDSNTTIDLITNAIINPLYTLEYYRTALPTNIVDLIWFRDRIIYLVPDGFIPSFKLDPGSYDARFIYQLAGDSSELCLFITKLDVGTFVVATTRDFYRVTGTFAIQTDPNDPTGETIFQDVNITPLGVSDPAISHSFTEYQGSILYVSATGIRLLNNGTSILINDSLDLLFRGEPRFDLSPFQLLAFDQSQIAVASQGTRIYWSLPHADGVNRIHVLNIGTQKNLLDINTRSWRMITFGDISPNPTCLFREEDGKLIFGTAASPNNKLRSMETQIGALLPIKIRTQFNYGQNPKTRKDILTFKCKINTNGKIASLVIRGLQYDGSINSTTVQFSTLGDTIISLDAKEHEDTIGGLPPSIAYSVEISCLADIFYLEWFSITFEERPEALRRAIVFSTNFDKAGRKRVGTWGFVADPLGLLTNDPTDITINIKADGVSQPSQVIIGNTLGPQTMFWNCDPTQDLLARDWELEIIGSDDFEFYKFLPPDITQETPGPSNQVIFPPNNFGTAGRKRITAWPFVANALNDPMTVFCRVDGIAQTPVVITPVFTDLIQTWEYIPPKDLIGIDWELKITASTMEFYKFMDPVIAETFPVRVKHAIQPFTNLGKPNLKKINVWPFICNGLGNQLTVRVWIDFVAQPDQLVTSTGIETLAWYNNIDIYGIDWQIEVFSTPTNDQLEEFEFYKFLPPDIAQVFPIARKIDQIGPLDFNAQGMVLEIRFRIMGTGAAHYKIYDGDVLAFEDDLQVTMVDNAQIVKVIKGINPSVCRTVLSSDNVFYRYSVEYLVHLTGKETDGRYIMVADASSK